MDWAVCIYIGGCIVLAVAYTESFCIGVRLRWGDVALAAVALVLWPIWVAGLIVWCLWLGLVSVWKSIKNT